VLADGLNKLVKNCSAAEGESGAPQEPQLDPISGAEPVLFGQTRRDLGALEAAMQYNTSHPHSTEVGPIDEVLHQNHPAPVCLSECRRHTDPNCRAFRDWQSVQFMLKAAEKKPCPHESFTESPEHLDVFEASSDIAAADPCQPCGLAAAQSGPQRHKIMFPWHNDRSTGLDFILPPSLAVREDAEPSGDRSRSEFAGLVRRFHSARQSI